MLLVALSLICASPVQSPPQDPEPSASVMSSPRVDAADFDAWRAQLAPREDETRWQEIPWRDTLVAGLAAASAEQKPLLLWLMNGHPLGCT